MKRLETSPSIASSTLKQASQLFTAHQQSIYEHTDRMFAVLMSVQWIAGVTAALWITPRTWIGTVSQTHIHVWAAIFLGGAISIFPITLALVRPGQISTRHVIATAQILMSALLIYLTGGRIETHFHVFGSLAFLAFYRDWRVLVPATIVVAADHFLRGVFWPQTVYGVLSSSSWRWLEHSGWVLFEDTFLYVAIKRSIAEMWDIAIRTAETRDLNKGLEQRVAERTRQIVSANEELHKEITERKLAEIAAGDSEERYRLLFEGNPLPMWVYDLETLGFLAVNDAAVNHYGFSRDEFLGMTIKDLRPSEEVPALTSNIARITDGLGEAAVWRHRKKDGATISVEITSHTLDFAGRLARVVLAVDVTELKRAEEESEQLAVKIENQRLRLNNIVASVPGVVWEAWGEPDTAAQRINFVSDYVQTMLGYTVEEWLSTPNFWLAIIHPDDKERAADEAASTFANGGRSTVEFRWLTKDGREVWVESNYVVITDDGGRPAGLRGVTTNVSERKRAEGELRASEERYRDLVENARDIIFSYDLKGNYTSINKAGEQITGYTRDEVLTLNLAHTIALEDLPKAQELITSQIAREKVTTCEMTIIAKDGRRIAVEANNRLVFQNGVPVGVQGIARDVTERKQLEDQLRQSQKMESIGTLAGGIAHDFNNLLTAITGYSELALSSLGSNDSLRPKIVEIRKAGHRAAALTRQLLAFSRKQILQPRVLDLNTVVVGISKMLARVIGEDVEMRIEVAPTLDRIKADLGQMEQILINLAVNARDAMPNGGLLTIATSNVHLHGKYISQHAVSTAGHYVVLSVSDNGCGMDTETRAHIFEPFYTTKEVGAGTGLGLSMVYGIVKQSGGTIWVYSEEGKGTSFKIYLPRVDDVVDAVNAGEFRILAARGHETILLVEDEDMVRGLSKEVLENYGYEVIVAPNGQEGLRICEEFDGEIDLVITDVVMPKMSGRELAERISSLRPDTRVLYMSGFTDDTIVRNGVLVDNICFIQKPFSPDDLALKVREVLDRIVAPENSNLPVLSLAF
jgi:two-component system cell cycle sensor histidine kinase/response regulator CckA